MRRSSRGPESLCEPRMILARNDLAVRRFEGLDQTVCLLSGRRVEELESEPVCVIPCVRSTATRRASISTRRPRAHTCAPTHAGGACSMRSPTSAASPCGPGRRRTRCARDRRVGARSRTRARDGGGQRAHGYRDGHRKCLPAPARIAPGGPSVRARGRRSAGLHEEPPRSSRVACAATATSTAWRCACSPRVDSCSRARAATT